PRRRHHEVPQGWLHRPPRPLRLRHGQHARTTADQPVRGLSLERRSWGDHPRDGAAATVKDEGYRARTVSASLTIVSARRRPKLESPREVALNEIRFTICM